MVELEVKFSTQELTTIYQAMLEKPFKDAEPVVLKIRAAIEDHNKALAEEDQKMKENKNGTS